VVDAFGVLNPVVLAYPCPFVRFPVLLVPFAVLYKVIEVFYEGDGVRDIPFALTVEGIEVGVGDGQGVGVGVKGVVVVTHRWGQGG
jgi:hypothetical protein